MVESFHIHDAYDTTKYQHFGIDEKSIRGVGWTTSVPSLFVSQVSLFNEIWAAKVMNFVFLLSIAARLMPKNMILLLLAAESLVQHQHERFFCGILPGKLQSSKKRMFWQLIRPVITAVLFTLVFIIYLEAWKPNYASRVCISAMNILMRKKSRTKRTASW